MGVVSALTWQNDTEFEKVEWIDCYKIIQQVSVLLRRFDIRYIKIGLVESIDVLHQLTTFLQTRIRNATIIFDPVMKASAGFVFHHGVHEKFAEALHQLYCITPNLPEATQIFGSDNLHEKLKLQSTTVNILLKGGHTKDPLATDILYTRQQTHSFTNPRLPYGEKHGSGCVLSSALTAQLALGQELPQAVEQANKYTYSFLGSNETLLGYHKPII